MRTPTAHDFELANIARQLAKVGEGKAAVLLMLRTMLICGDLETALSVPKITAYQFGFRLPGSRADLVLWHFGGSVSVIEAAGPGRPRDIVRRIGNLCWCASILPSVLSERPAFIRSILTAPLEIEQWMPMVRACAIADVTFQQLCTVAELRRLIERSRLERKE